MNPSAGVAAWPSRAKRSVGRELAQGRRSLARGRSRCAQLSRRVLLSVARCMPIRARRHRSPMARYALLLRGPGRDPSAALAEPRALRAWRSSS